MLKIKKAPFQVQSIELNMRQRTFEKESIVSLMMDLSFYPRELDGEIVSGSISVVVDTNQIHCLNDLEQKTFDQEVKVSCAISRNGFWEHYDAYDGILTFQTRKKNQIAFTLESKKNELHIEGVATMVSLYTTSTKEKELKENFQMKDFYQTPIKKEIQKRLPVSEKSRKKTVLYKKRFVKEKALKIIFCEHY